MMGWFWDGIALYAQQLAFPTAEGSGRFAIGGRGGEVYKVTHLGNNGPGSIVDAVASGRRTIVFSVSGTIDLGGIILRPKSYTTIAGQTAPGDGICIKGRIYIGAVTDVIIRHIRVRVDAGAANSSGDAIDIAEGKNIIIDHVSASYARDEGISCQERSDKVTVQWCIISESLTFESHSYGSLVRGDYGDQKTYHHNLYAHNWGRNPRPGNYTATSVDSEGLYFDFRNNVIYNWKGSDPGYNADINSTSRYNFIGNVYIPGPESSSSKRIFKESCPDCYGYFADNAYDDVVPPDPWSYVYFSGLTAQQINAYKARSYPVPMEPVKTTSPAQAKIDVLAHSGATVPKRDIIDQRIVNDVLNKTGHSISTTDQQSEGAWPPLFSTPAPQDSDHDGMPDDWELAHQLDAHDSNDRNVIGQDGYTQLEVYLNSLTGEMTPAMVAERRQQPEQFALCQNYPNPFNANTTIEFVMPHFGHGELTLFDLMGSEVMKLVDQELAEGRHRYNLHAAHLPAGMYILRLKLGTFVALRKMMIIK